MNRRIPTLDEFIKESEEVNEDFTPQFKRLLKKAKALRIDNAQDLQDLIADEFSSDGEDAITGSDYESAKMILKIKESYDFDESKLEEGRVWSKTTKKMTKEESDKKWTRIMNILRRSSNSSFPGFCQRHEEGGKYFFIIKADSDQRDDIEDVLDESIVNEAKTTTYYVAIHKNDNYVQVFVADMPPYTFNSAASGQGSKFRVVYTTTDKTAAYSRRDDIQQNGTNF